MIKVILPSAKVVTKDLQGIGRFPAIIYPVDQMRMVDLFYKQYIEESTGVESLNVISFEEYEQVEKRTQNRDKVNLIKLDKLNDLGYTISFGIKELELTDDDDIIINFADVTVSYDLQGDFGDKCFYSYEEPSSKWTYFDNREGCIFNCYDKIRDYSSIKTKQMFIGVFCISKPLTLSKLIDKYCGLNDEVDSFWRAIEKYSIDNSFEMIYTDEWFDVGHIEKYYDLQMAIKSRTFNHIVIDKDRGILTKTSDDKSKFIGEIKWYLKLPTDIEYARPRIFSYSLEYARPYVSMEYYAYHTLHELFLFGDLSEEQWKNVFRRIRFVFNDFARYTIRDTSIKDSLREMYLDKTIKRIKQMDGIEYFPSFNEDIIINGVRYLSINDLLDIIPKLVENKLLDIECFNIIHGDLCFSNIMIDPNYSFIKLIDPRGKFGKFDIYGDKRYELAKLMHSIDGKYDYIIKDKFEFSGEKNKFDYRIDYDQKTDIYKCFLQIFEEEVNEYDEEMRLIEALLFFSMIPLHDESMQQQLIMLGTGIRILDSVYDIKK